LTNLKLDDSGEYECYVGQAEDEIRIDVVKVIVERPPTQTENDQRNVRAEIDTLVTLKCSLNRDTSIDQQDIKWRRTDGKVKNQIIY
jgi:hypothetical protein